MFDQAFREIADRTVPTMQRYAETFGFEFFASACDAHGRPPSWAKILRVREALEAGFDYCLYVDADTMFVRFDRNILDDIDAARDLNLTWHDPANSEIYAPVPAHFNCGVMAWRNSTWSLAFLDGIWQQSKFIDHIWWEQAALHSLLGYRSALDPGLADRPDADRRAHVGRLSVNWNVIAGHTVAPDPVVVHFAGKPWPVRLAAIDRERATLKMREILPPAERHKLSRHMNLMTHQDFQLHCARETEQATYPAALKRQAEQLGRTHDASTMLFAVVMADRLFALRNRLAPPRSRRERLLRAMFAPWVTRLRAHEDLPTQG